MCERACEMLLTEDEGGGSHPEKDESPTPARRKLSMRKVYDRLHKYLAHQGMNCLIGGRYCC